MSTSSMTPSAKWSVQKVHMFAHKLAVSRNSRFTALRELQSRSLRTLLNGLCLVSQVREKKEKNKQPDVTTGIRALSLPACPLYTLL